MTTLTTKTAKRLKRLMEKCKTNNLREYDKYSSNIISILNFKNELKEIAKECTFDEKFKEGMFALMVDKLIQEIESLEAR